MPDLILTIRPTGDIRRLPGGDLARVWVAELPGGLHALILVAAVAVPTAAEQTAFEQNLMETPPLPLVVA